jgi:predicted transcriptional regulator
VPVLPLLPHWTVPRLSTWREKDHLRQLRSKANEEASQLRGRLEATYRSLEKLEQRNAQLSEQNDRLQTALLESVKAHVSAPEQKEEKPLVAPPASE